MEFRSVMKEQFYLKSIDSEIYLMIDQFAVVLREILLFFEIV